MHSKCGENKLQSRDINCFSYFMSSCTNRIEDLSNLFALQPTKGQTKPCPRFSSFLNLLSPTVSAAGVFIQKLISPVVLFPRIFSLQQVHLFSGPSLRVCYSFFSRLQCVKQEFTFLFLKKIRRTVLVIYKLELGFYLIIPNVFLEFSHIVLEHRSSFREVFQLFSKMM